MAQSSQTDRKYPHEAGFMLVAVVVMVALVLIALAVAAPVVARDLRRDKEVESQRRMQQYVRAISCYYRKFNSYPASIKALEKTNNIRFLRHQYVDPLTGKADYKLIHQGEQQTKIHIFFGQELAGLTASLGSAAGLVSAGGVGATPGSSTSNCIGATSAASAGFQGACSNSTSNGSSGSTGASGSTGSTGSNAFGDGTGGIIVGVGTSKTGSSITEPNGQDTYEKWEFWYDPRIELLKKSVQLTGSGGMGSSSASGFGAGSASTYGQGLNGQSNAASGSTGSTGSTGPPVNPFP